MKCDNCGGNADTLDKVLVSCDGDFACSKKCADQYREKMDRFVRDVLPSEEKTEAWLYGDL